MKIARFIFSFSHVSSLTSTRDFLWILSSHTSPLLLFLCRKKLSSVASYCGACHLTNLVNENPSFHRNEFQGIRFLKKTRRCEQNSLLGHIRFVRALRWDAERRNFKIHIKDNSCELRIKNLKSNWKNDWAIKNLFELDWINLIGQLSTSVLSKSIQFVSFQLIWDIQPIYCRILGPILCCIFFSFKLWTE